LAKDEFECNRTGTDFGELTSHDLFGPLKQHMGCRGFYNNEEVNMAIREPERKSPISTTMEFLNSWQNWTNALVLEDAVEK
jgi:hypothetical protein